MYFTVSVSISCHRMVKLLAVKADILYCYIASRKVVPSKRISSYQFPHKILFEFDKGDSRMASSSIHDVGIQHSNFKHMKENFVIPNISFHKPAASCYVLITQINSSHMGVVQVNQLWLCNVLPLPLSSCFHPSLYLSNSQTLRES